MQSQIYDIVLAHNGHRGLLKAGDSIHLSFDAVAILREFIAELAAKRGVLQKFVTESLGFSMADLHSKEADFVESMVLNLNKLRDAQLLKLIQSQARALTKRFGYWYLDAIGLIAICVRDLVTEEPVLISQD